MNKIEIFKTPFQAQRQAKADFEKIIGIKDVPVEKVSNFYLPSSTKCVCGETSVVYFQPISNGHQEKIIASHLTDWHGGTAFAYGVCRHCGKTY